MKQSSTYPTIETDISAERLRLLLAGATIAGQSLEPREVAASALNIASEALGLSLGLVILLRQGKQVLLANQGFPQDWLREFRSSTIDFSGTIIGETLADKQPQIFSTLNRASTDEVLQYLQRLQVQSLACLPLQVSGSIPGILLIAGSKPYDFQETDIHFLKAIVAQVNTGLHNAWLFSQSQRQLEEARSVAEAARAVSSTLDSTQILTRIMEEVTTRLNTEAAALLMLDRVRQELEFVAVAGPESDKLKGMRLPMGQGIVGWVAKRNEPLLVPDVSRDPRFFKGLDKQTETTSQAILCVPLRARAELIGVVEVINKKQGQFSNADQRLLESLAAFAAVAIENARYYEEANRQIEQATLYAHDLSATFKQERQQRESLDKLRYSFLNVVGHELKTPLTIILQGTEALSNRKIGPLNPDQDEIVEMLTNQSDYLHRLIDGLIAFATFSARQGTMKFKQVPFETVLDETLMLAKFKAKPKQITLADYRQPPLPTLSLDKEQLSEALMQILDNALKFTPTGGQITIATETGNNQLTICIIDQGAGIPEDQIVSIWDSFVQLNTTMERGLEGLGLGLAIARYIIEAHNGEISVESEVGKGSTFTVRLPV